MKIIIAILLSLGLSFGMSKTDQKAPGVETILLDLHNTVTLRGEVNENTVMKTQLELNELVKQRGIRNYTLYLVLDTPGGSIDAGNMFIQYAKTIHNLKTITISAASMGTAIVSQLPGERLIISTGISMYHRAAAGISGQVEEGELESRLAMVKALVKHLELMNAARIGISLKEYKEKVVNEWWIFGEDNIRQNTADRVVNVKCSTRLTSEETTASSAGFFGTSTYKTSKCPLVRGIL